MDKRLLVIGIVIIIIAAIVYLSIFNVFAVKPFLEKPELTYLEGRFDVQAGHIAWSLNELGAYKLHAILFSGEDPEMEIRIEDTNKTFAVKVVDGETQVDQGTATNSDLKITTDSSSFEQLVTSENTQDTAKQLHDQGKISIELEKSEADLILKGYKEIYDVFY